MTAVPTATPTIIARVSTETTVARWCRGNHLPATVVQALKRRGWAAADRNVAARAHP